MPETPIDILVIQDRPQIAVTLEKNGDVTIRTAGIADDFMAVSSEEVVIPADCIEAVAKALLEAIR